MKDVARVTVSYENITNTNFTMMPGFKSGESTQETVTRLAVSITFNLLNQFWWFYSVSQARDLNTTFENYVKTIMHLNQANLWGNPGTLQAEIMHDFLRFVTNRTFGPSTGVQLMGRSVDNRFLYSAFQVSLYAYCIIGAKVALASLS